MSAPASRTTRRPAGNRDSVGPTPAAGEPRACRARRCRPVPARARRARRGRRRRAARSARASAAAPGPGTGSWSRGTASPRRSPARSGEGCRGRGRTRPGRGPRRRAGHRSGDRPWCRPCHRSARPALPTWAARYGDTVYTMAYRLTGDPHDAADLAQDVFVRVLGNLHRYEPGTFEGWLYRVTKNLFLDQVRRRTRVRFELLDDADHAVPATLEPRLQQGLDRLSPDFRLAVVLCDLQGLTYEEITEATGWPIGTVRSRIHRARRSLREHLAATSSEAEDAISRRPRAGWEPDRGGQASAGDDVEGDDRGA